MSPKAYYITASIQPRQTGSDEKNFLTYRRPKGTDIMGKLELDACHVHVETA